MSYFIDLKNSPAAVPACIQTQENGIIYFLGYIISLGQLFFMINK